MADKILHKEDFKRVLEASEFSILVFGRQCGVRKNVDLEPRYLGSVKCRKLTNTKWPAESHGLGSGQVSDSGSHYPMLRLCDLGQLN